MAFEGPKVFPIFAATGNVAVAINGTASANTAPYSTNKNSRYAFNWQAASGGTIALQVEIEYSKDGTNFFLHEANRKLQTNLDDSDEHGTGWGTAPFPYLRFKVTGLSGNAATTTIRFYVSVTRGNL